jgi:hypothetical protein
VRICGFCVFKSVLLCVKSRQMKKRYILFLLLIIFATKGFAQDIDKNVEERLKNFFENYTCSSAQIGKCKLNSFKLEFRCKEAGYICYRKLCLPTISTRNGRRYISLSVTNTTRSGMLFQNNRLHRWQVHRRTYPKHLQKKKKR